ncbi:MAG: hypothetical protein AAB215_09510 [Planctomycetota bacterium]|mgnify:CR=1 FL=1
MRNGKSVENELASAMRRYIRSLDSKARLSEASIQVVPSGYGTFDVIATHPSFGNLNPAARLDRLWPFMRKALSREALELVAGVSMATPEEVDYARAIGAIPSKPEMVAI